jgi:hypothetical protein
MRAVLVSLSCWQCCCAFAPLRAGNAATPPSISPLTSQTPHPPPQRGSHGSAVPHGSQLLFCDSRFDRAGARFRAAAADGGAYPTQPTHTRTRTILFDNNTLRFWPFDPTLDPLTWTAMTNHPPPLHHHRHDFHDRPRFLVGGRRRRRRSHLTTKGNYRFPLKLCLCKCDSAFGMEGAGGGEAGKGGPAKQHSPAAPAPTVKK